MTFGMLLEEAYERGYKRGYKRGYNRGYEQGLQNAREKLIRKLIAFKTVEEIAEFLEISQEEVESLLENHPA